MIQIWVVIVLAVAVAVLATTLGFTIKGNLQLQKELEFIRMDYHSAEVTLARIREERRSLEKALAYKDGIRIGRRSDTLYQQILKKFTDREQFTVMMNGMKEGEDK